MQTRVKEERRRGVGWGLGKGGEGRGEAGRKRRVGRVRRRGWGIEGWLRGRRGKRRGGRG